MKNRPIRMLTRSLVWPIGLSLSLAACVTTTTGGFENASEEQALQDYVQLAIAYYDANDLVGARRHIANAMEIDNRNSSVYNVLALISQAEGDIELAEENFLRAISLDRDNARARNNYAALMFETGQFEEAFEQLQRVTEDVNYEGRAVAFENQGRAALRLNRRDDAATAFSRALQLNGNLYISALELAILEIHQERWLLAERRFQQYLTTVQFYNIPHTPRALLAGIQIGDKASNQEWVRDFSLILTTLYRDSPEFVIYSRLSDVN